MARLKEFYKSDVAPAMMSKFGYKSVMQIPKLDKVVINVGCGELKDNPKMLDAIIGDLGKITGQKAMPCKAHKSVANFKLREGMVIGAKVTLRGERMYEFVDKLFNIALPRVRDFRGINGNSFDGRGDYNLGIREQLIFPEIEYDKIDKVRGMDITFVTTAENNEQAAASDSNAQNNTENSSKGGANTSSVSGAKNNSSSSSSYNNISSSNTSNNSTSTPQVLEPFSKDNDSDKLSFDKDFSLFSYFGQTQTFSAIAANGDGSDIEWQVEPKFFSISTPKVDGAKSTVDITWDKEKVEDIERTPFYAMLKSNPYEKITGTIYLSNGQAPSEEEQQQDAGSKKEFESEEVKNFVEDMYKTGLTQENSVYDLSLLGDTNNNTGATDFSNMSDEEILKAFEEK